MMQEIYEELCMRLSSSAFCHAQFLLPSSLVSSTSRPQLTPLLLELLPSSPLPNFFISFTTRTAWQQPQLSPAHSSRQQPPLPVTLQPSSPSRRPIAHCKQPPSQSSPSSPLPAVTSSRQQPSRLLAHAFNKPLHHPLGLFTTSSPHYTCPFKPCTASTMPLTMLTTTPQPLHITLNLTSHHQQHTPAAPALHLFTPLPSSSSPLPPSASAHHHAYNLTPSSGLSHATLHACFTQSLTNTKPSLPCFCLHRHLPLPPSRSHHQTLSSSFTSLSFFLNACISQ